MRQFHWKKVSQRNAAASVWGKIGQQDITQTLDLGLLQEKFERKKPQAKKAAAAGSTGPKRSAALAGGRQQNVGIVLSYLKLEPEEVRDALLGCKADVLGKEALENLLSAVPQEDEIKALSREVGDADIEWGKPEKFLHMMGTQVSDMNDRITLWLYSLDFTPSITAVERDLAVFDAALVLLLREDTKFTELLGLIVAIGNALNQGTAHAAMGFRMESLGDLSVMKANDGTSLLDFLVQTVMDSKPDLLDISKELGPVAHARSLNLTDIAKTAQGLSNSMERVKRRLKRRSSIPPGVSVEDGLPALLTAFQDASQDRVSALSAAMTATQGRAHELAQHFGEDSAGFEPSAFFGHVIAFQKQFEGAVADRRQRITREARQKEREKAADARAGPAGAKAAGTPTQEDRLAGKIKDKLRSRMEAMRGESDDDSDDFDDDSGPAPPKVKPTS